MSDKSRCFYDTLIEKVCEVSLAMRSSDIRRLKNSIIDDIRAIESGAEITEKLNVGMIKSNNEKDARIKELEDENLQLKRDIIIALNNLAQEIEKNDLPRHNN